MAFSSQIQSDFLKRRIKFRSMLYKLSQQMDEKDIECLSFHYEIDGKDKKATDVMNSLVEVKKVEDDPDLLLLLKSVLTDTDDLKKKDLGDVVDDYLTSAMPTQFSAGLPVTDQASNCDPVYQSSKGLIGTTEGKGTVTSTDFLSGEDEHTGVISELGRFEAGGEQFMQEAKDIAQKESEDEQTKVGAVIVKNNEIIGSGVNRMPRDCAGKFPLARKGRSTLETKYPYITHAVIVGIVKALKDGKCLEGATVYTTLFPGHIDAQLMVECGIKEIVYEDNLYPKQPYIQAAIKIFKEAGVVVRCMQPGSEPV